jgi:hypothetical protein
VRSFTVTGLGPAPATPSFITPANNAQFHLVESFNIQWSSVVNAQSYILEADDEPTFSYPLTLTLAPINFGTQSGAIWGNALTIYYRVRAVSVDGVRSLPSATRTVQITNAAPIPAGVSPVAPANGATVQLPFFVDWSDTPNPQVPGYDLEFNTSPNFRLGTMALLVSPSRSDYMITRDLLAPGNYFWRVRALTRRRRRLLVGRALDHGDSSRRSSECKFVRDSRRTGQCVRWQHCARPRDVG